MIKCIYKLKVIIIIIIFIIVENLNFFKVLLKKYF